jgi:hypothetical protein
MTTSQYVFTSSQRSKEFERLQAIEQVFDPAKDGFNQQESQRVGAAWKWGQEQDQ